MKKYINSQTRKATLKSWSVLNGKLRTFFTLIIAFFLFSCETANPLDEGVHWNYTIQCENGFKYKILSNRQGVIQLLNSDGTPMKVKLKNKYMIYFIFRILLTIFIFIPVGILVGIAAFLTWNIYFLDIGLQLLGEIWYPENRNN